MTAGGPLWGAAIALMLATLLVVNLVRLKRSSDGRFPLVATGVAVVVVLAVVALVVVLGQG